MTNARCSILLLCFLLILPVQSAATPFQVLTDESVRFVVETFRKEAYPTHESSKFLFAKEQFVIDLESQAVKSLYFRDTPLDQYMIPDLARKLNALSDFKQSFWDDELISKANESADPNSAWRLMLSRPVVLTEFPGLVFFLYSEEIDGILHSIGVIKLDLNSECQDKVVEKVQYLFSNFLPKRTLRP